MDFLAKLRAAWAKNDTLLCVGLDPDKDKLPAALSGSDQPLYEFNKAIIDATADCVCAYKPNSAFYEAAGAYGIKQLELTCRYIKERYPELPIILDFKRGDIEHTNEQYVRYAFDYLGVDAVTVQPFLGSEALKPFLDRKDKGIIVLSKTSNPGAAEIQDLVVDGGGQKLYLKVAQVVKDSWNQNGNCGLVVGATFANELANVRQLVGDDMVFLVPGLGAQGGDVSSFVRAGLNKNNDGLIINSSRSIIYAAGGADFAAAARQAADQARQEINNYRGN